MADITTTTSTVAGAAAGAVVTMVPAAMLGAQTDALGLGLFGALLVCMWLRSVRTRSRAFSAVLLSGLLAGYGSPIAASVASGYLSGMHVDALRLPMALLIGVLSPTLVPILLRVAAARVDQGGVL